MSAVPLPNAFARWREDDEDAGAWGRPDCDVYTADQLRAYGDARASEERERCAAIMLSNAEACSGITREILMANVEAIRASATPRQAHGVG